MSFPFERDKPLSDICTFGVGGPARYFAEIRTINEMQLALKTATSAHLPYFILGKGSNCLFDDRGFNGVVILNKIDFIEIPSPGVFHVGSGYSFSLLGTQTARQGWSGLEFASGIPGSVGGAIFMNAGANGHETCECLTSVEFINENGQLLVFQKENLHFTYRTSSFHDMPGAIVGATFSLETSSNARSKQIDIISYRKKTQPYGEMSAGCVFRNPSCGHAGKLIEQSGLKGASMGEARVSELHANFIINEANASSQDILSLIELIKRKVRDKTGVELESEIRYIPFVESP